MWLLDDVNLNPVSRDLCGRDCYFSLGIQPGPALATSTYRTCYKSPRLLEVQRLILQPKDSIRISLDDERKDCVGPWRLRVGLVVHVFCYRRARTHRTNTRVSYNRFETSGRVVVPSRHTQFRGVTTSSWARPLGHQ